MSTRRQATQDRNLSRLNFFAVSLQIIRPLEIGYGDHLIGTCNSPSSSSTLLQRGRSVPFGHSISTEEGSGSFITPLKGTVFNPKQFNSKFISELDVFASPGSAAAPPFGFRWESILEDGRTESYRPLADGSLEKQKSFCLKKNKTF